MEPLVLSLLLALTVCGTATEASADTDPRLELLQDLAVHSDTPGITEYQRLTADPQAAQAELDDAGDNPNEQQIRDRALLHVADLGRVISSTDWAGDADALLDAFDAQLARFSAQTSAQQRASIIAYADSHLPMQRGDYIGWMFGPMAEHAQQHGLMLLDLNNGSDRYHFFVLPVALCHKWLGRKLSENLQVENPAWQFEQQLQHSPYQRLFEQPSCPQ